MHENSAARCASTKEAASPQQPWRKLISGLLLPCQSSRESERWQRHFARDQRCLSQEEETAEGSSGSSSSEGSCCTCNDVPLRINERLKCTKWNKRRPSFSDTESVLDVVKMPVGTTNPVLKSSFSMTSLRSSTPTDSPEHCVPLRLKTERAYHSLTKKSRQSSEQDKEQWRKSWGSGISQDGKEFWEGFQADYDYLMAQNILDRDLSEVSVENGIPRTPQVWSHSEFMDHFAQLYSWLKGIQDSVYGKEENFTDWKLRAERLEYMQRQRFRLDNFKEKAEKLIERHPGCEGEVLWRMKHISDKWENVEAIMGGCQKCEGEKGSEEKIKHEIRCLRKWLRELDTKLKPLSFRRGWTIAELEEKSKELMVLHRDIESQKKIFSSLFKLCKKKGNQKWLLVTGALEHKYHFLYLRFLEWQYYLESLIGRQNKTSSNVSIESDGEPVPKIARFATADCSDDRHEREESDASDGLKSDEEYTKDDDWLMETSFKRKDSKSPTGQLPPPPDKMVSAKAEVQDESILGVGRSAAVLGTNSRDTNSSFSRGDEGANSRPKSAGQPTNGENRLRDVNTAVEPETNRSTERPPNTGSFEWRHLDTDSEQDKAMSEKESKEKKDSKDAETTSSEGGWTYASRTGTEQSEIGVVGGGKPKAASRLDFGETRQMTHFSAKNIPPMPDGLEPFSSRKLVERVEELLKCRPSKPWKSRRGRTKKGSKEKVLDSCDASGEYTEDSEECQKSEDEEWNFASCRRYGSADGILETKNVPRRQRQTLKHRPWSMSSFSCFRSPRNLRPQASMSESDLNRMLESERISRAMRGEDGNSWRRKRTKMRKQTNKKSESDALTLSGSDSTGASPPGKLIPVLAKSGSFSGVTKKQRGASTSDSVTEETEEEAYRLPPPALCLGSCPSGVTFASDVQTEEPSSLNWDNYQDKYQSEAYSEEPPDLDTAKKILEFGEDYGMFLGNQSDCASTRGRSFLGRRSSKIDSDSDVGEVRHTLKESLSQLELWELNFNKIVGGITPSHEDDSEDFVVYKSFLDEIILVCKRNVECLTKLLVEVKDEIHLAKEYNGILNVKESWENLKSTAEAHKAKQLRREMAVLKEELLKMTEAVDGLESTVTCREELEGKITKIQNELGLMKKGKGRLLQANVSVHKFLASTKHSDAALREEVTELYQLWDQTFYRFSSQLINLQSLSQAWYDFENRLSELQCALRMDTHKVLDFACGVSLSLQDIAGILSDKESARKDSLAETSTDRKASVPFLATLSTEGSLSDSGISDSGSEQELNEREKRLLQLKRLAKRLETILAPGSQALLSMFQRIEQAESDLRELQRKCRDLIVRSASTEEIKAIVANKPELGGLLSEEPLECGSRTGSPPPPAEDSGAPTDETDDCDGGKSGRKFWLWRLLRYAFPFQLALVALLCIASILEPRCCDSLNNLELSLHPQLRYDSGPPPV